MPSRRQSGRRQADRRSPLRDQGRPRRSARRLRARLAGMARDSTSRSAARSSTRPRRCCASAPTSSRATMTQEQGKPLAEAKARGPRLGAAVRLVRRGRQARLWPHPRPPRRPAQPRHPPAGRPDRDLHAVELPDLSAGEEGQRRARRRLHGDLAPAARNARLSAPSCSARSPTPASPTASRSWSTATAAWSATRSSPAASSARSASPARPTSASI